MREHQLMRDTKIGGFVLVLFALLSVLVFSAVGFAVDIGHVYNEQRRIQIAADAAALAGVATLGADASYARVFDAVTTISNANSISIDEVSLIPPRCGSWTGGTFSPSSNNQCDSSTSAIEVTIRRTVRLGFARVSHEGDFTLTARSVGYSPTSSGANCIRPLGVEGSYFASLNIPVGGTFSIGGTQGAGNWGKIDIFGNSSSGPQYTSMMLSNACDDSFVAGGIVSQGTGNADIQQVFDTLLSDQTPPFAAQGMVVAVTSDFTQGNGSVTIQRFLRVDLLSHQGNGKSWTSTFRVVDLDAEPEPPPTTSRQLVE